MKYNELSKITLFSNSPVCGCWKCYYKLRLKIDKFYSGEPEQGILPFNGSVSSLQLLNPDWSCYLNLLNSYFLKVLISCSPLLSITVLAVLLWRMEWFYLCVMWIFFLLHLKYLKHLFLLPFLYLSILKGWLFNISRSCWNHIGFLGYITLSRLCHQTLKVLNFPTVISSASHICLWEYSFLFCFKMLFSRVWLLLSLFVT